MSIARAIVQSRCEEKEMLSWSQTVACRVLSKQKFAQGNGA